MKRWWTVAIGCCVGLLGLAYALLAVAAAVCPEAGSPQSPRDATELFWDDGVFEDVLSGVSGAQAAVRFTAPEDARYLLGARIYTAECQASTSWPFEDYVAPFNVWVWASSADTSAGPALPTKIEPACTGLTCPHDAWLDVEFNPPVRLVDAGAFPGGVFFVGVEWEHRFCPYLGIDESPPVSGRSWVRSGTTWNRLLEGDMLLRAVVSDTFDSSVSERSWGSIKAMCW
jgi:hypothetical protein